nr:MAG TPA: hypothetical protein [Caudoviricetes sp.]
MTLKVVKPFVNTFCKIIFVDFSRAFLYCHR